MAFYLDCVLSCTRYLMRTVSCWWPRHLIGAVLVSLPALAVFVHVICNMHLSIQVDLHLHTGKHHTGMEQGGFRVTCLFCVG